MGKNWDEYYLAFMEMTMLIKKNISNEELRRFFDAGERSIAVLEGTIDEIKAEDASRLFEYKLDLCKTGPFILADMYMCFGYWEDALRVYRFCKQIPYPCHSGFDELEYYAVEIQNCVRSIRHALLQGVHSLKKIRPMLEDKYTRYSIYWAVHNYRGFCRTKQNGEYFLDLVPKSILPGRLHGGGPVEPS